MVYIVKIPVKDTDLTVYYIFSANVIADTENLWKSSKNTYHSICFRKRVKHVFSLVILLQNSDTMYRIPLYRSV